MDNNEDIRFFGYCECCNEEMTDENESYYIDDDGQMFCCIECLCEHYGITKIEI